MTEKKQTITQAWNEAVEQMKQDCQRDGTHIWHAVQDRSHCVAEYRPDYDEWFGDGFMGAESTLPIVDVLDDHLMTLMRLAAKDELMKEFEAIADDLYYNCARSNHNNYAFVYEETSHAFELFCALKGYN